jgi:hypothetical protein
MMDSAHRTDEPGAVLMARVMLVLVLVRVVEVEGDLLIHSPEEGVGPDQSIHSHDRGVAVQVDHGVLVVVLARSNALVQAAVVAVAVSVEVVRGGRHRHGLTCVQHCRLNETRTMMQGRLPYTREPDQDCLRVLMPTRLRMRRTVWGR